MTAEGVRGRTGSRDGQGPLRFPESAHQSGDNAQPWNMTAIHAGMAPLNARFNPKSADPGTLAKIADLLENRPSCAP